MAAPALADRLAALADPTRARLLLLLDGRELAVAELCRVLQLPQSTVSRHLKALAGGGWVASRAEGPSNLYVLARDALDPPARRLWLIVREHTAALPAAALDRRRLQAALAARRIRSQEFFSSAAGRWDRLREELFGGRFHLAALAGLLDPRSVVADLGCGTGPVSAALAPFVARVIAVDSSPAMLRAARRRLRGAGHVELRRGDLEAVPIDDGEADGATMMLVLHHVPEPGQALAETARILRGGGRLVVVDMLPHDRERYRRQMGHLWLGFSEAQMRELLARAGFDAIRIVPLPAEARASGPALFAAAARRPG
jgi:ubiquinone/menaquinone biosynthesis C-methylase UbiE